MSDPYVIVEGGLVQNNPSIPVYDFDVLRDDFVDADTFESVEALIERLSEHIHSLSPERIDTGRRSELAYWKQQCEQWLENNEDLRNSDV